MTTQTLISDRLSSFRILSPRCRLPLLHIYSPLSVSHTHKNTHIFQQMTMTIKNAYFRKQSREHQHFCLGLIAPIESIFYLFPHKQLQLNHTLPSPLFFNPLLLFSPTYTHPCTHTSICSPERIHH